jgi:NADPH:quinone reductase
MSRTACTGFGPSNATTDSRTVGSTCSTSSVRRTVPTTEVSLSDNIGFDMAVVANDAVVAVHASRANRPVVPFWPLLFANTTLRMMGSDDFSRSAKAIAVQELTAAASLGVLQLVVAARYELSDIALAHDQVDAGARGRILLTPL